METLGHVTRLVVQEYQVLVDEDGAQEVADPTRIVYFQQYVGDQAGGKTKQNEKKRNETKERKPDTRPVEKPRAVRCHQGSRRTGENPSRLGSARASYELRGGHDAPDDKRISTTRDWLVRAGAPEEPDRGGIA